MPAPQIAWEASAGTYGRKIFGNIGFNIWWGYNAQEELPAHLYSNREICFICIFSAIILSDDKGSNQFREVVHDDSGKKLLDNVLHLFCVKMEQANRVFQLSERCFNTPAHSVKAFEFLRRKVTRIQIGNDCFISGIRDLESDDTERQSIPTDRISFPAGGG